MSRKLLSGNLVISANGGGFEFTDQGFTTGDNFTYTRASTDPFRGVYHGLFSVAISSSETNVFRNFIADNSPIAGQKYIIQAWVKLGSANIIQDTDKIKLSLAGTDYTINIQTIFTGAQLSSDNYQLLELDITLDSDYFFTDTFLTLALESSGGGPATTFPTGQLLVDAITCFRYEEIGYELFLSHRFSSPNNSNSYKWEIYKKGFQGVAAEVDGSSTPLIYSNESGNEFEESVIIAGSASASIVSKVSLFEYSFLKANDKEYYLVIYEDVSGTYTERWRGFILPSQYMQDFYFNPVMMDLTFSDLLGDLKNIPFATDDEIILNSAIFNGLISEIELIGYCLRRLEMLEIDTVNVAVSYLEDSQTGANKALKQTFVDPELFYSSELKDAVERVSKTDSLADVIEAILKKYTAKIIQWDKSYWIVDFYNQKQASYQYQIYDLFGVELGTNTETGLIVDFKESTNTDRWRFKGRQRLIGTNSYKNINLTLRGRTNESGLLFQMIKDNVIFSDGNLEEPYILGFGASDEVSIPIVFFYEDSVDRDQEIYLTKKGVTDVNQRLYNGSTSEPTINGNQELWTNFRLVYDNVGIDTIETFRPNSGFTLTRNLNLKVGDRLQFEIDFSSIIFERGEIFFSHPLTPPPYLNLNYYLQSGSFYWDATNQTWDASLVKNVDFIDFSQSGLTQEISAAVRATTTEEVKLTVFMPSHWEHDFKAGGPSLIPAVMEGLPVANLDPGFRYIVKTTSAPNEDNRFGLEYYYYQLNASADVPAGAVTWEKIVSTVDSDLCWELTNSVKFGNSEATLNTVKNISLNYLPSNNEVDDDQLIKRTGNIENISTYESDLDLFDAPGNVLNSELIFDNISLLSNSSPTDLWTDGDGNTAKIQTHRLNILTELLKQSRQKMSGEAHLDVPLSPLRTYRIPSLDNVKYYAKDLSFNFKDETINAEFTEIESDLIDTDLFAHETASHSVGHN